MELNLKHKTKAQAISKHGLQANISEVKYTEDYDRFRFLSRNREIDPKHVKKIVETLRHSNKLHIHPLHVDKDLNVIDGQHRLMAAKELGIGVYYIVDEHGSDTNIVALNNLSLKWRREDYVHARETANDPGFAELRSLSAKHGFSVHAILTMLGFGYSYKKAKFDWLCEPKNYKSIDDMLGFISQYRNLAIELKPNITKAFYRSSNADARAIMLLLECARFDRDYFLQKLTKHSNKIEMQARMTDWLNLFIDIYNTFRKDGRLAAVTTRKGMVVSSKVISLD